MSKTETLHMSIGEGAGHIIMNIAQEKLTCELNPQKGLKVIMDSLIGIPKDMALNVLSGDNVLPVDVESQQLLYSNADDHVGEGFPKVDIAEWTRMKFKQFENESESMLDMVTDWRRRIKENYNGSIKINLNTESIISLIKGDASILMKQLMEDDDSCGIVYMTKAVEMFIKRLKQFRSCCDWLEDNYKSKFKNWEMFSTQFDDTIIDIEWHYDILSKFTPKEEKLLSYTGAKSDLDRYLDATKEIDETLDKGIVPVNIMDNFSAGWLAPNGDFYGLNGEIANMLHNTIADALYEIGIVPNTTDMNKQSPDVWLEHNGWAKVMKGWVLYGGYDLPKFNKEIVPMTDKQVDVLSRYGQVHYKGILELGYKHKMMSAAMFQMIEPTMMKRLFGLD